MIKNPPMSRIRSIERNFPRYFVGLVIMATGSGKALDIPGFVGVIEGYRLLPDWLGASLAYSLPCIELGSALMLLSGCFLLVGAGLAVGLHLAMISAVLITLNRGIEVENCGCFGVFLARPLGVNTLIEDLVMLLFSVWAWINALKSKKED